MSYLKSYEMKIVRIYICKDIDNKDTKKFEMFFLVKILACVGESLWNNKHAQSS